MRPSGLKRQSTEERLLVRAAGRAQHRVDHLSVSFTDHKPAPAGKSMNVDGSRPLTGCFSLRVFCSCVVTDRFVRSHHGVK